MQETTASTHSATIQALYAKLKKGLAHEQVNDANVQELIDLARRDGHATLEKELREWQSDCGGAA